MAFLLGRPVLLQGAVYSAGSVYKWSHGGRLAAFQGWKLPYIQTGSQVKLLATPLLRALAFKQAEGEPY